MTVGCEGLYLYFMGALAYLGLASSLYISGTLKDRCEDTGVVLICGTIFWPLAMLLFSIVPVFYAIQGKEGD